MTDNWTGGVSCRRRRYRCRKGHESDTKVTYWYGGRCVAFCQHCYLDLLERECGGVVEIADEPEPDHVAGGVVESPAATGPQ